jgi:hypothetical protein
VADLLYLSCWIRGFTEHNMLRHWQRLLELFPYSKLSQYGGVLRVYAVEYTEPPLLEREFPAPLQPAEVIAVSREVQNADCAFELRAYWDLWQLTAADWQVTPTPVLLTCFGPLFENEDGDKLRIDFGIDANFLPSEHPQALAMTRSNVRSLLRFVHQVDDALPMERRRLWNESGENFAERLKSALEPE